VPAEDAVPTAEPMPGLCVQTVTFSEHRVSHPTPSFAKLPAGDFNNLQNVSLAIFGAAEGSPYDSSRPSHSANAPTVLREASAKFAGQLQQFDFDLGTALLGPDGENFGMVDYGDIPTDARDAEGNRSRITQATRAVLAAGAVPIILGGDDSVPIPWFAGFEGKGPYTVLQVDAHADWADVIKGNAFGYGSTMRRAAQMPWVNGMVQVGARGLGSGGAWQIEDARQWGSHIVTMRDLRRHGMEVALSAIQPGAEVLISIDCDGLDPAVLPAVNMPTPGGLNYMDMMELLTGVAGKARIAGVALVEYVPERDDPNKLSALTAARIAAVAMGLIQKSRESS
jgi:agmatinase